MGGSSSKPKEDTCSSKQGEGNEIFMSAQDEPKRIRVERITDDMVVTITREHGIDPDIIQLLKEAAIAIDDFDSYRDNMKIKAYGVEITYVIAAGKGDNLLVIRRDGSGNIVCKWRKNSFEARVFNVWLPFLFKFLGHVIFGAPLAIAGRVGRKALTLH